MRGLVDWLLFNEEIRIIIPVIPEEEGRETVNK